jgi:hypothetical protein
MHEKSYSIFNSFPTNAFMSIFKAFPPTAEVPHQREILPVLTHFPALGRLFEPSFDIGGSAIFVTSRASRMSEGIGFLRAMNVDVDVSSDLNGVGETLSDPLSIWTMLIVDVDIFSGEYEFLETLLSIRSRNPGLIIILISRAFARDDHSTERLAICDVSIKAPVRLGSFEVSLQDAIANNLVWQSRVFELSGIKQ